MIARLASIALVGVVASVPALTAAHDAIVASASAPTAAHEGHKAHGATARQGYVRSTARYEIPDARLVDMHGQEVSLRDSLASRRPVMVNFVFTSCKTICPAQSATFALVQESMVGKDLELVSISIDPEHDTPSRLREYAAKFSAGPRWQFLTGNEASSIAVQRAFDVYRGDKMGHDPVTFIRATPGEPWVRVEGFASASDLIREYGTIVHR